MTVVVHEGLLICVVKSLGGASTLHCGHVVLVERGQSTVAEAIERALAGAAPSGSAAVALCLHSDTESA